MKGIETALKISAKLKGRRVGGAISGKRSEESRKRIQIAAKNRVKSNRKGIKHTLETIEKMRAAKLGHNVSEESRNLMRIAKLGTHPTQETIEKMRQSHLGIKSSETTKEKLKAIVTLFWSTDRGKERRKEASHAMTEKNSNLEFRLSQHKKPNKPEIKLQKLLDSEFPNEWKYVGDGNFILAGKCPDFVNINGKKAIIELYGSYWHKGQDPNVRINLFSEYGYSTLVLWENQLDKEYAVKAIKDKFYIRT